MHHQKEGKKQGKEEDEEDEEDEDEPTLARHVSAAALRLWKDLQGCSGAFPNESQWTVMACIVLEKKLKGTRVSTFLPLCLATGKMKKERKKERKNDKK